MHAQKLPCNATRQHYDRNGGISRKCQQKTQGLRENNNYYYLSEIS